MLLALLLQEFVRQHPSDHIDSETRKYLDDVTVLRLGYSMSFNRYMPIGSYSEAGNLCNRLAMEMSSRRSNFEEMTSLSMEYGCKIDIELVIPTLLPPPPTASAPPGSFFSLRLVQIQKGEDEAGHLRTPTYQMLG